jgi:hypothetical protein
MNRTANTSAAASLAVPESSTAASALAAMAATTAATMGALPGWRTSAKAFHFLTAHFFSKASPPAVFYPDITTARKHSSTIMPIEGLTNPCTHARIRHRGRCRNGKRAFA